MTDATNHIDETMLLFTNETLDALITFIRSNEMTDVMAGGRSDIIEKIEALRNQDTITSEVKNNFVSVLHALRKNQSLYVRKFAIALSENRDMENYCGVSTTELNDSIIPAIQDFANVLKNRRSQYFNGSYANRVKIEASTLLTGMGPLVHVFEGGEVATTISSKELTEHLGRLGKVMSSGKSGCDSGVCGL